MATPTMSKIRVFVFTVCYILLPVSSLVILMHGRSFNETDFFGLARESLGLTCQRFEALFVSDILRKQRDLH